MRRVELTRRFGGMLVWEVRLANRVRLYIDGTTGAILVIERPGDNVNWNINDNDNDNDDNDRGGNFNGNRNRNRNDESSRRR
ncbi:MAG: hypothetical protein ACUVSX_11720 [Aggregatilineales bacterium]